MALQPCCNPTRINGIGGAQVTTLPQSYTPGPRLRVSVTSLTLDPEQLVRNVTSEGGGHDG